MHQPNFLLMHHHMGWAQCCYRKQGVNGNQWHTHHDLCQIPKNGTHAQIEKEALATVWACDKFASYIVGLKFHIETDHKPLVPLLGSKHLDALPPRILRFRLRLARFDYTIQHVPGKLCVQQMHCLERQGPSLKLTSS